MAQDNKVVSFKARNLPDRFSLPGSLVRLRDVSGRSLKAVMSGFFDKADDSLFELADKASTNQDQTAYFDAMRELRLRRKNMTVSVLQYVSRAFNEIGSFRPASGSRTLDEVEQDSLALMDHADLEQQVAIDNLINKLRNQHAEAIGLLNVRVSHLVPSAELDDSQMPLSPEVICGGVAEACADLDIDIRAKLVVLKLFDRLLVGILGDVYKDANKTLIAEGVLPDMRRAPAGGRPSSGRAPGAAGSGGILSEKAGSDSAGPLTAPPGDVGATFSELSALLHKGQSGATGRPSGGTVLLDTGALMLRLSDIQAQSLHWRQGEVVPLSEQLQPVFRAETGGAFNVGQVDNDVINLVSMLFDFILEDRQLHPVMKAVIGRLQIPVLKVALSDRNFFNRGGHPVRKLVNELAMSAIGWTEKKAGQRDPLREKIESVVDRVLNEFTDNVDLFSELLSDFGHFMDLDRRRRELVEQRLRDAEEGRARQERASRATEALLSEQMTGRDLPPQVVTLLNEAWSKYLQWIVLREGDDSERWQAATEFTRQLVWSVDPKPVEESTRSELLRAIPGIVDRLRSALQEIAWDPFATDAAIRDLELAHVDVFQRLVTASRHPAAAEKPVQPETPGDKISAAAHPQDRELPAKTPQSPEPLTTPEPAAAVSEPVVSRAAEAPEAGSGVELQWLERADGLRVGSWIELIRDGGKIRCKLAAFIKATGKYIFVNRSGAKVAEYQREDLAMALAAEEITMLDDGLIFDRALESIIDNLRSSRKD
ncbi:DUF1631 domain-containing protein [Marinobacter orientalis]|uniref:DUF1631 domain-containing protein n=1 Tax=Marinobacter orientalis TaxID=1928859 RepID=A0A7Y0RFQ0_9GAMM|nr:DUF1631 domain-containing protein [Marinobacter orientalis]NMT65371.1 DUF1631 domain-containing protein [Marinobacter orientalis]TGX47604.1 DUF1631 domain-containing protein [Marinobacter orientalis]